MQEQLQGPGARRWSTDEVDQRRALAHWVDTVCDRFLEIDIDSPLRDGFRARLEQADLGAATLNFIEAERQSVHRTLAKIARSRFPVFLLLQLRVGQVRLRQLGREIYVRPGESVLVDGTEPYELECPQATSALAVRLPELWLKHWVPFPERYPARHFTGSGWSSALNASLASLSADSCNHLPVAPSIVAEQIAVLLALAIGREPPAAGRSTQLEQLMNTLRDRLHEVSLSPLAVADAHRISKRSVHYAFAQAGTTFIEELMRLRLERAKEILVDPRLSDLPVSEVAAQCGFTDPSHFARRFRREFAQAPLQFRNSSVRMKH